MSQAGFAQGALQLPGSHNHIHGITLAEDENILAQEELNPQLGKQIVLFGGNIHYLISLKVRQPWSPGLCGDTDPKAQPHIHLLLHCAKLWIQGFEVVPMGSFPVNGCLEILQSHFP